MAGRKQATINCLNDLIGPRTGQWLRALRPGLPPIMVEDPRWFSYREAESGVGVGYRARMDDGFLHAFSLGQPSPHPWVVALSEGRLRPTLGAVREVLSSYYDLVRPTDVASWLDVDPAACPEWRGLPPTAAVLPWSLVSAAEAQAKAELRAARERRGYRLDTSTPMGSPSFGPMAEVQIDAEARKLVALADRLAREPIDPSRLDYDLGATVLLDGERIRWFGNAGRHRIAVMRARGAAQIDLAVRALVRREDVDHWPQVANGTISRSAALAVFDRVMEGRAPALAQRWIESLDAFASE